MWRMWWTVGFFYLILYYTQGAYSWSSFWMLFSLSPKNNRMWILIAFPPWFCHVDCELNIPMIVDDWFFWKQKLPSYFRFSLFISEKFFLSLKFVGIIFCRFFSASPLKFVYAWFSPMFTIPIANAKHRWLRKFRKQKLESSFSFYSTLHKFFYKCLLFILWFSSVSFVESPRF